MENANLGFRIYKICQILKCFAGTFHWAQTLKLGGVYYHIMGKNQLKLPEVIEILYGDSLYESIFQSLMTVLSSGAPLVLKSSKSIYCHTKLVVWTTSINNHCYVQLQNLSQYGKVKSFESVCLRSIWVPISPVFKKSGESYIIQN